MSHKDTVNEKGGQVPFIMQEAKEENQYYFSNDETQFSQGFRG